MDVKKQAELFAANMKRQRDIEWLEQRLIRISGLREYEEEEQEIKKQLRQLKRK